MNGEVGSERNKISAESAPCLLRARCVGIITESDKRALKLCSATLIDLSRIATNNDVESRSEWTKIQETYENVHPNLVLVLLFVHTEVERGKSLFSAKKCRNLLADW